MKEVHNQVYRVRVTSHGTEWEILTLKKGSVVWEWDEILEDIVRVDDFIICHITKRIKIKDRGGPKKSLYDLTVEVYPS